MLVPVAPLDCFVRGNQLFATDWNMTNAFGTLALLMAFCGLPVGVYHFLLTSEPAFLCSTGSRGLRVASAYPRRSEALPGWQPSPILPRGTPGNCFAYSLRNAASEINEIGTALQHLQHPLAGSLTVGR
jgi:hypothetical protein